MEKDILIKDDWQRCVEFHGHICPGLAIGYKAAQIGMRELRAWCAQQGVDLGEVVAIVQNDACGVDAVQVLTGCTFGKGNLLFRDHGKQVFTFVRRADGQGVRVALRFGVLENKSHQALRAKVMGGMGSDEEVAAFQAGQRELARRIVEGEAAEFFVWRSVQIALPGGPKLNPTVPCAFCGEGVMEQRAHVREGKIACPECAEKYESRVLVLNK